MVRRASWSAPAGELPRTTSAPGRATAGCRAASSPARRSSASRRYVDFESPSLLRALARFLAPARERAPGAPVEFTEMLPGPEDCWLESDAGRHTSELRVVALDR